MKRLLVVVFAVPAILFGLLAMHVMTSGVVGESAPAHSMSESMPTPADDCDGSCAPSHEILGMICVLALLAVIVAVYPRSIRIRWGDLARFIATRAARAVALAPPLPHTPTSPNSKPAWSARSRASISTSSGKACRARWPKVRPRA